MAFPLLYIFSPIFKKLLLNRYPNKVRHLGDKRNNLFPAQRYIDYRH
ncbi:hypothetical protein [Abyssogena phaseoliformis symbiont]